MAYVSTTLLICQHNQGIAMFPKQVMFNMKMKKCDLVIALQKGNLNSIGTVAVLKERLQMHLTSLQNEYKDRGINTSKVLLSEAICPSCICASSQHDQIIVSCDQITVSCDQIIVSCDQIIVSCDQHHSIYAVALSFNGDAVLGDVQFLLNYPENVQNIVESFLQRSTIFQHYQT